LGIFLPGNDIAEHQTAYDIQRFTLGSQCVLDTLLIAHCQLVPCDNEGCKLTCKMHTPKDTITYSQIGANRYLLGIVFFATLFGSAQADISSDSGVNQALIVFEAALTNSGLAIVAFATILQYTGGFARRVSPLETLKALLVWLSGGINLNELHLSFGVKDHNSDSIMDHVMPLTAVTMGQSIMSLGMKAQERGTLILGLGDKIPITIAKPVVKMEYAVVGLIALGICIAAIPNGIWWNSYGAYASSLFLIYVVMFQSIALSLGWSSNLQINALKVKYPIQDDEIKNDAITWLQELKTLLDAGFEHAQNPSIRCQSASEKIWFFKFLMQWAFDVELVTGNVHDISKLDGNWSSSVKFMDVFSSNLSQDSSCLHDVNDKLNRITRFMTNNNLVYDSIYINLLALAAHVPVNTLQDWNYHSYPQPGPCGCRDKPWCIYATRVDGKAVYLSSVNFMQPQSPGKWKHAWLLLCSIVAITNILYCYLAIFVTLQLPVKAYWLAFSNLPNYGDVYGCLNCFNNAYYFRNGTLLPHQQITKFTLFPLARLEIGVGVIAVCSSLLATVIVVMPAIFPRLFKHYDCACRNHRWLCWCIKLLANSFMYDKYCMAFICTAFGGVLSISSGFKIVPPENTGFLGWTSTTCYTVALLVTGFTAAVRHMILSGARI
jgi:hypothetical protein